MFRPEFYNTMERAILAYDFWCDQTGDDHPLGCEHHSGNCVVFFKGDIEDLDRIKDFIVKEVKSKLPDEVS